MQLRCPRALFACVLCFLCSSSTMAAAPRQEVQLRELAALHLKLGFAVGRIASKGKNKEWLVAEREPLGFLGVDNFWITVQQGKLRVGRPGQPS